MTTAQLLNSMGLVFAMIGVVIIFIYAPPQPNLETGVAIGLEDNTPLSDGQTVAQHNEHTRRLRARHSFMSKAGLICVFLGFAFQLGATWS